MPYEMAHPIKLLSMGNATFMRTHEIIRNKKRRINRRQKVDEFFLFCFQFGGSDFNFLNHRFFFASHSKTLSTAQGTFGIAIAATGEHR